MSQGQRHMRDTQYQTKTQIMVVQSNLRRQTNDIRRHNRTNDIGQTTWLMDMKRRQRRRPKKDAEEEKEGGTDLKIGIPQFSVRNYKACQNTQHKKQRTFFPGVVPSKLQSLTLSCSAASLPFSKSCVLLAQAAHKDWISSIWFLGNSLSLQRIQNATKHC